MGVLDVIYKEKWRAKNLTILSPLSINEFRDSISPNIQIKSVT